MPSTFKHYRKNAGFKQKDVALRLGLERGSISKWETGENVQSSRLLPKIAALYGCTVDELLKPLDNAPTESEAT